MAKKNLGHYEGEVEEPTKEAIKSMHPIHKELYALSLSKKLLESKLASINAEIDQYKSVIQKNIDSGKKFSWVWIWNMKRTSVKWKEEFVKALGQPKAEAITKTYKTKEYPQLGIRFIDPIPESIVQTKENPSKFPKVKHALKK